MTYPGAGSPALNSVDFDIYPGESVAIMGASGSGKSTMLHLLAGILLPTQGSVTMYTTGGPIQIQRLTDKQRSLLRRAQFGFVFQQGLLLDELTALENVAVARMLLGDSRREAEAAAKVWLQRFGLAGLENRRLGQLSGGQAQRVAIARAQVNGAQLLFADEPTGALDSQTGAEVLEVLLHSAAALGKSVVMVTHDLQVAAHCDRVVTLHDGGVVKPQPHQQVPVDFDFLLDPRLQPAFAEAS